jgi:hypothetical protein
MKMQESPGNFGGILLIWPWKRDARITTPRIRANISVLELETAKEILAEVFHARPADVEEMIQKRLEKRDWNEEKREEGLWPATFCLNQ